MCENCVPRNFSACRTCTHSPSKNPHAIAHHPTHGQHRSKGSRSACYEIIRACYCHQHHTREVIKQSACSQIPAMPRCDHRCQRSRLSPIVYHCEAGGQLITLLQRFLDQLLQDEDPRCRYQDYHLADCHCQQQLLNEGVEDTRVTVLISDLITRLKSQPCSLHFHPHGHQERAYYLSVAATSCTCHCQSMNRIETGSLREILSSFVDEWHDRTQAHPDFCGNCCDGTAQCVTLIEEILQSLDTFGIHQYGIHRKGNEEASRQIVSKTCNVGVGICACRDCVNENATGCCRHGSHQAASHVPNSDNREVFLTRSARRNRPRN